MFVLPKRRKHLLDMARLGMERMRAAIKTARWQLCIAQTNAMIIRVTTRHKQLTMRKRLHDLIDWVKGRFAGQIFVSDTHNMSSFLISRVDRELHLKIMHSSQMNGVKCLLYPVRETSHLQYLVRNSDGNNIMHDTMPQVDMNEEVRVCTDYSDEGIIHYFKAKRVMITTHDEGLTFVFNMKNVPQLKIFLRTMLDEDQLVVADQAEALDEDELVVIDEPYTPPMP